MHVWKLLLGNVAALSSDGGGFTLRVTKPDGSVVAEARWKSATTEAPAVASVVDAVRASIAPPVVGAAQESAVDATVVPADDVTPPPAPGPRVNLDLLLGLKPGELYTFLRENDMGFPSIFVVRVVAVERQRQSAVLRVELHGNPQKPRKEKGEKRLTLGADDSMPVYVWSGAVPGVILARESLSVISGFDAEQITEIAGKAVASGAPLPIVSGPVGAVWVSPLRASTAAPSDVVREAESSLDRAGAVKVLRVGTFFSRPDSPLSMETLPDDLRARVADVQALGATALVDDVDRVIADLEAAHAARVARIESAVSSADVGAPAVDPMARLRGGASIVVPDGDPEGGSEEDGPTRRAVTIETVASSEDAVARLRLAGNVANVFVGAALGEVRSGVVEPTCDASPDVVAACHWRLFIPWTRGAVAEDDVAAVRFGVEVALGAEGVVVLDPGAEPEDAPAIRARVEAIRADVVRSLAPTPAPEAPAPAPEAPAPATETSARVRVVSVGLKLDRWTEVMPLLPGGKDAVDEKGARASRLVDVVVDRRIEATQAEFDAFVLSLLEERPQWFGGEVGVIEVVAPGRNRVYALAYGYTYARYVGFDVGTTSDWSPMTDAYAAPPPYVVREGMLAGSNLERLWTLASTAGRKLTFLHLVQAHMHGPSVPGRVVLTIVEPPERVTGEGPTAGYIASVTVKGRTAETGDALISLTFPGARGSGFGRTSAPLYVYDGDVPIAFPPRDCYGDEKAIHVAAGAVEAPPLVAGYVPGPFAPSLMPPDAIDPRNAPENRPAYPVGTRVFVVNDPSRHGSVKSIHTTWYSGRGSHTYEVQTDPGKLMNYVSQASLGREEGDPPAFVSDIVADVGFHGGLHTPQEVIAEASAQDKAYDEAIARKGRVKSDATRRSAQADADLAAGRRAKLVEKLRAWGSDHPAALEALLATLKASGDDTKQRQYLFAVRSGLRTAATPAPVSVPASESEAPASSLPRDVPAAPPGSSPSVVGIGIYISKKTGARRVAVRTVKGGECGNAIAAATSGNWHWSGGLRWWSAALDKAHGPNTSARRLIAEFVPSFNPEGEATFAFGDEEGAAPAPAAVEAPAASIPGASVVVPKIAAVAKQYRDAFVIDVTWEDGARYFKKEVVRGKEGRAPVDATPGAVAGLLTTAVQKIGARIKNTGNDYDHALPAVSRFGFGMVAGPVVGGDFAASVGNWRRIAITVTPPQGSCEWGGHVQRKTGGGYASSYADISLDEAMEFASDACLTFLQESLGWDNAQLERNRGVLCPEHLTLPWPEVMKPAWTTAKRSEDYARTVLVEEGFVPLDDKREYRTAQPARAVLVHRDDVENQLYRYNRVGTSRKMNPGELALSKLATMANTSAIGRGPLEAPSSRACATLVEVKYKLMSPEVDHEEKLVFSEMARWSPEKVGDGDWTDAERRVLARALVVVNGRAHGASARLMIHYLYGDQLGADGRNQEAGYSGTVMYFGVGETTTTKADELRSPAAALEKRAERATERDRALRAKVEKMTEKECKAEHRCTRAEYIADIERDIASTRERVMTGSDAVSSILRDVDALAELGVTIPSVPVDDFVKANGGAPAGAARPRRSLAWVTTSERRMIFFLQGPRGRRLAAMARMLAAVAEYKAHAGGDAVDAETSLVGRSFGDQTYRLEVMAAGSNADRSRIFASVAVALLEALVSFGTEKERASNPWEVESLSIEERSAVRLRQVVRRREGEPVIDDSSFASPLPQAESAELLRDFDMVMLCVVVKDVADVDATKRALAGARQATLQLVGASMWADAPEPFVAGGEKGPTPREVRLAFLIETESFKHNPEQGTAHLDAAERSLATFASSVGMEAVYRHAAQIDDGSVIAAWCGSNQRCRRAQPIDGAPLLAAVEAVAAAIVKGRWEFLYTYATDKIRLTPAMQNNGREAGRDNDTVMISEAFRGVVEADVASSIIFAYNKEDRSRRLKWAKGQDGESLRRFIEDRAIALNGFANLSGSSRWGDSAESVSYYRRPGEMQGPLLLRPGDALDVPGVHPVWPGNMNIGAVDTIALSGMPIGLQSSARPEGFAMVVVEAGVSEAARSMLRELSDSAKATVQVMRDRESTPHPAFAAVAEDFRSVAASADGGRVAHVVAVQHHPGVGDDFDSIVYLADEGRDVVCPVKGSLWAAVVNNVDPDAARFVAGPEDRLKSADRHGGRGRISARDPAACVVLFRRNRAVAVVYPLSFSDKFPLRFTAGPKELKAIMPKIVAEPAPAPTPEEVRAPVPAAAPEPAPASEPSDDEVAAMLAAELGL